MSISVFFETYGCQMNVSDTERAREAVDKAGMSLAENSDVADVVLLNTCSIRAKAERKVMARVHELNHESRNKGQILGVMGCVAQLEGDNLFDSKGRISLVVGTQAIKRLPQLIDEAFTAKKKTLDLGPGIVNDNESLKISSRVSKSVAFVPIIEGCNKFCTYCIVPYSRGRERSRSAAEIVSEVVELKNSGFKEVHLIGQNVNSYRPTGSDILLNSYVGNTPFVRLLKAVSATGIERVKFTTSYPRDFHEEIVDTIDLHPNLCNWIHLPVQTGSDKILKAMRRGYTRAEYLQKIEKIAQSTRNISITTDIIVGFPGESDNDFNDTLSLMKECEFTSSYIFNYSARTGTPAFQLFDSVKQEIKIERFQELSDLQSKIQSHKFSQLIGTSQPVLVEGLSSKDKKNYTGHTTCHKVVNFTSRETIPGSIAMVKITSAKSHSLFGKAL